MRRDTLIIFYTYKENVFLYGGGRVLVNTAKTIGDTLVIFSEDNRNFKFFLNDKFETNINSPGTFLEYPGLLNALKMFLYDYQQFVYINDTVISKHSVLATRYLFKTFSSRWKAYKASTMFGRIDYLPRFSKSSPYISTFYFEFDHHAGCFIFQKLTNFSWRDVIDNPLYTFVRNPLEKNKNYSSKKEYVRFLKRNTLFLEKEISFEFRNKYNGNCETHAIINSLILRMFEFIKNFLFKRVQPLRRILSLL